MIWAVAVFAGWVLLLLLVCAFCALTDEAPKPLLRRAKQSHVRLVPREDDAA